ncbi:B3 domain-containing transcription factor VRN1 [Glycine max]|uniref:B3 domain-containing transcription factor VRN1 n=1 Tax=Glycine max TaxID=3847 RepID=UPI0003DEAC34|nr:B3 domain-containing transcription factor VRN1 [Glycine max]
MDAIVSLNTLSTRVTPSSLQTACMAAHRPGRDATLPILFFKIILKTNLERLKIPNKFTSKYGGGLPNPVFIKPLDGTQWKVNWTKQNGEVWFEKGWKEFVEHYSLDHGHLIFFKYEGTSQIDVLILDQSALEIDYLCDTCDENEILDHTHEAPNMIFGEWPDQKAEKIRGPKFSTSPQVFLLHSTGEEPIERTSSLNMPTQSRAKEVARNFISYNPFFTVFIKPVHVADGRLPLPDLKGIIENKEKYLKLQLGERSWNVKLLNNRLSAGWTSFASESELQPGDVCVFELINREDSVFKVHVFKRQC